MDESKLFSIGGTYKLFCANHVVNDKDLIMDIDPGTAVSLIQNMYFEISVQNYLYNHLTPY